MDSRGPEIRGASPRDPRFIPGYTGYCPQLKFHMAKPYGKLTAELLKETPSERLQILSAQSGTSHPAVGGKDLTGMIPGYMGTVVTKTFSAPIFPDKHCDSNLLQQSATAGPASFYVTNQGGFVPRSEKHFGCTFTETSRRALTEFRQEERETTRRRSPDLPLLRSHQSHRPDLPLRATCSAVPAYESLNPFVPPGKPYHMDDHDPRKYFISGFTGHVPKSRFLFGKGYPAITNQALVDHGKQQRYLKSRGAANRKRSPAPPERAASEGGAVDFRPRPRSELALHANKAS